MNTPRIARVPVGLEDPTEEAARILRVHRDHVLEASTAADIVEGNRVYIPSAPTTADQEDS